MLKKLDLYEYFFQNWMHIEETLMILNISIFDKRWSKNIIKFRKTFKREFDSEPVYNEKYLITKVKSYKGKINTNFYNNKIPKKGFQYVCLSLMLIDWIYRKNKRYYSQAFLEEWKHTVKKEKTFEYITDEIEISSDDSDREDSNEKY